MRDTTCREGKKGLERAPNEERAHQEKAGDVLHDAGLNSLSACMLHDDAEFSEKQMNAKVNCKRSEDWQKRILIAQDSDLKKCHAAEEVDFHDLISPTGSKCFW